MDMATLLKNTANVLVGVSLVRWLAADFRAEIRQDTASLRQKANGLVRRSPYRAAGLAAAAGALMGMALSHRRPPRTIPTRF
ncbi:MAG TPA: hypothetical protein VGI32_02500 [Steroidobacteraceae bacterium]|jgi:ElaB/YqjD/DUF883 family membrane-anchored ribosome-binding protein